MTYESASHLVAMFGPIYFGLLFAVAVTYALWPSKRKTFDAAARLPLEE